MDTVPEDIEAMQAAIHQFWIDRVRECIQAGILREGDPEELSVTMWAHAHGMAQLYHEGCMPLSEEEFRAVFRQSGLRLMTGMATEAFLEEAEALARDEEEVAA
jgi:hypothetical protein